MKSLRRVLGALLVLLVVGITLWGGEPDLPTAGRTYHDAWAGDQDLLTQMLGPGIEPAFLERSGLGPSEYLIFPADRTAESDPEVVPPGRADARANAVDDPPQYSTVQSETSIALNGDSGTLCVTWNDIYHYFQGMGICGFSRSTDGGATWTDGGPMPPGPGNNTCRGDPSVAWRAADGYFYFTGLDNGGPSNPNGISIWRSTDDCASFQWYGTVQRTGYEDKELLTVDNHPTSPYYGRFYVAWLQLDTELHYFSYSSDGLTWTPPLTIGDPAERPGGDFPIAAPNGDVYVGWAGWHEFPFGLVDQDMLRSTDGGNSFSWITPPAENTVPPRDPTAEEYCNFIAIRGFMRYLPSLQIAITPGVSGDPDDYCLHVIYPYDPDGYAVGDAANVYYRRSCDYGQTWGPEILLNDDGGLTDQYYPSLAANENGVIIATWYDRRNDPDFNYYVERWGTVSYDNGDTWEPNRQIGDAASPIYIDTLSFCNHGDYDLMAADPDYAYVVWSESRTYTNGHYDQDIWFDKLPLWPDFDLQAESEAFDLCRPSAATSTLDLGSVFFYDQPVTLSDSGVPAGVNTAFSPNPIPSLPGSAVYSIDVTAGAADGSYTWTVSGASPTLTHDVTVTLVLNSAIPGSPTLTDPPDGAVDLPQGHILFQWSDLPEATSYHLQVDDDPAFGSPEADVGGIETSPYDLPGQLDPATTYYWRVSAANGCGESAFSGEFSFSTAAPCFLLVDDDNDHPDMTPYYLDALNILGYAYDVFDVGGGTGDGPTLAEMAPYSAVIWFSGDKVGGGAGPNPSDESNLAAYLDGGGRLFLSSQDYLNDFGWTSFGAAYLGIGGYTGDDADQRVMVGQAGDPIGAGYVYFPTYPPDFVERGDVVEPSVGTSVAFKSRQGHNLALDKDGGAWKTVFFASSWAPLHFIEADPDAAVLGRILNWFGGCAAPPQLPAIVVQPSSLEATLYADEQLTQTLWISNVGEAELTFELAEMSRTLDFSYVGRRSPDRAPWDPAAAAGLPNAAAGLPNAAAGLPTGGLTELGGGFYAYVGRRSPDRAPWETGPGGGFYAYVGRRSPDRAPWDPAAAAGLDAAAGLPNAAAGLPTGGLTGPGGGGLLTAASSRSYADPLVDPAVWGQVQAQGQAEAILYLRELADLSPAYAIQDWEARGRFVYERLVETAERSGGTLFAWLEEAGAAPRQLLAANAIVATVDAEMLEAIAGRPEVARVGPNSTVALSLSDQGEAFPPPTPADERRWFDLPGESGWGTLVVEWNVAKIRADEVWATFGLTGEGIVVGDIDTGVMYTHPALVGQYRGNLGGGNYDHNYNWFDFVNGQPAPYDDTGHGTLTTGVMVGDDGGANQIGVAPGAEWIAVKPDFTYANLHAALDWMLAPTDLSGSNPDPSKRPHVGLNLWGYLGCDTEFQPDLQAWRAANILPVFASGQSGPACNSPVLPAGLPEATGAGSTDINDVVASWSSRGPSCWGELKPEVSAPGVSIRSSYNNGGYGVYTGSSYSAAHLAGTAALVLSADPSLDSSQVEAIITGTAVCIQDLSCGGSACPDGANNVYGWGLIDAFEAVSATLGGPPEPYDIPWLSEDPLSGTVAPSESTPIAVTYDAAGLAPGIYRGQLDVGSDDPSTPHVYVPVTLTVLPPCDPVVIVTVTTSISGCLVTFGAEVSGTAPYAYTWDFGAFGGSTDPTPTVDFGSDGRYLYTLTVGNCQGTAEDSYSGEVTVACSVCQPVTATAFSWMPLTPTLGEVVTFTASASGTVPISYSWNFDFAKFEFGNPITHVFTLAGSYTVTLVATNGCGVETVQRTLTAVPAPPTEWIIYLPVVFK